MAVVHDVVDDPLEVGVVPGHHADEQVSRPGDGVRLQHFRYGGQVLDDGGVAAAALAALDVATAMAWLPALFICEGSGDGRFDAPLFVSMAIF